MNLEIKNRIEMIEEDFKLMKQEALQGNLNTSIKALYSINLKNSQLLILFQNELRNV